MRLFLLRMLAASLIAAIVAACGGGGGDSGRDSGVFEPSAIGSAEGFYSGVASSGQFLNALVLDFGEYFMWYGNGGVIEGVVQGTAVTGSTTFVSTNGIDFNLVSGRRIPANISATYQPRAFLSGTLAEGQQAVDFSMSFQPIYDLPVSLPVLAGSYAGTSATLSGAAQLSFAITADGAIAGTWTEGSLTPCAFQGALLPYGNGKNVYDMSFQFTGGACFFGGGGMRGYAVPVPSGIGLTVYLLGVSPVRTDAFVGAASKLIAVAPVPFDDGLSPPQAPVPLAVPAVIR